jgi:superfamily II DNA/RNA helicase
LDHNIDRLVQRFLSDPVVHSVDPSAGAVSTMEHHVFHVLDETDKRAVTTRIAARDGRVILFLDTKRSADRLAKRLLAAGVRAAALHGGRSQPQRNRTLEQFKNGQVTALVATNVAARGIHIDNLDLVVNVDPPTDHKDYLHRGGRTARAGDSGSVVTLVLPEQKRDVTRLMSAAGIRPVTARVTSSDTHLATVTGAREPSGVPVTIEVPQPAAPATPRRARTTGSAESGGRSGRRRAGAATGRGAGTGGRGTERRSAAGTAASNGSAATGDRAPARRAGARGTTEGAAATGAASGRATRGSGRQAARGGTTGGAARTGGRDSDRRGGPRASAG